MKMIQAKLAQIQSELKAPKGQYNSFGKYKYRSCEDILEAVKPVLKKTKTALVLADEVVEVGGRVYVKATATLYDTEDGSSISNTAYAREPEDKKGMDVSQITGTASSYSRKYALNGLFAIDDTKDADTDEYTTQTQQKPNKSELDYVKNADGVTQVRSLKKSEKDTWFVLQDMTEKQLRFVVSADAYKQAHAEAEMLLKERFGIEL